MVHNEHQNGFENSDSSAHPSNEKQTPDALTPSLDVTVLRWLPLGFPSPSTLGHSPLAVDGTDPAISQGSSLRDPQTVTQALSLLSQGT